MIKRIVMICLVILLAAVIVYAQVPEKMSYQGMVYKLDAHSKKKALAAGNYNLQLNFYDNYSGGTLVTQDAQQVTADKNGLYSVTIGNNGFPSGNGNLNPDYFAKYLWLEIVITSGADRHVTYPYTIPGGRVQLTSVPYAFQSQVADTATVATKALSIDPTVDMLYLKSVYATGTISCNGGIQSDLNGPVLKYKKMSGLVGSNPNASIPFTHGLTASKILSVSVNIYNGENHIPPGYTDSGGLLYNYFWDATYVTIRLMNATYLYQGSTITVLITYEQ